MFSIILKTLHIWRFQTWSWVHTWSYFEKKTFLKCMKKSQFKREVGKLFFFHSRGPEILYDQKISVLNMHNFPHHFWNWSWGNHNDALSCQPNCNFSDKTTFVKIKFILSLKWSVSHLALSWIGRSRRGQPIVWWDIKGGASSKTIPG